MNLDRRAELAREARRRLARKSFRWFAVWAWPLITGTQYVANTIGERIIATLQRVGDGELTRVLIACPPGVGKSTMLACYSAWRIVRDATHRSLHVGHASTLAQTESRRVRRLISSDEFRAMFPAIAIRADANTAALWETTSNGHYVAVGIDAGITGKRGVEAVVDDGLNAVDRFSKAARETLWSFFIEGLTPRLDDIDGKSPSMIVVMQRLDRDDLIGRLIEAGGWHLVKLPAEEPDGTLNAPNVLSRDRLDGLKKQMGSAAYACQYLQEPSDDANALVKRAWWRFHRPPWVAENAPRPSGCDTELPAVETPKEFDRIVIAVDMTFGGIKSSNDYADVAVWAAVGGARYLLERWHMKASQLDQRAAIEDMQSRYPDAKVLIEKAAGGAGAIEQLTADGIPNIIAVTTGGRDKDQRLGIVSPTIEGGNCFLPLGAAWLGDFVEELAGATKHDDAKDTTAYALADLNKTKSWPDYRNLGR